ncbi:hypothetical protein [Streptomyces sp. NBC_00470]
MSKSERRTTGDTGSHQVVDHLASYAASFLFTVIGAKNAVRSLWSR